MAELVYQAIMSLDGYAAAPDGDISWSEPTAQVHAHVNEREAATTMYLLGRRTYDLMRVWDALLLDETISPEEHEFAQLWRDTDKIVVSRTLPELDAPRTRVVREFDPVAMARFLDDTEGVVSIGGPTLAAEAFAAGLVTVVRLYVHPVILGDGLRAMPTAHRLDLDLVGSRRFDDGSVFVEYRVPR